VVNESSHSHQRHWQTAGKLKRGIFFAYGLLIASTVACSGNLQLVAPRLPADYADIGPAAGGACGLQFLGLIPIMSRSTLSRAYEQALANSAGALSLRDVTVSETWAWTPLGPYFCANVSGIGIKRR